MKKPLNICRGNGDEVWCQRLPLNYLEYTMWHELKLYSSSRVVHRTNLVPSKTTEPTMERTKFSLINFWERDQVLAMIQSFPKMLCTVDWWRPLDLYLFCLLVSETPYWCIFMHPARRNGKFAVFHFIEWPC